MKEWILKAERGLLSVERALLVLLVGGMIALSFMQVVLRLFHANSLLWADPLLRHMLLWAGFFGAALAAASQKHFALDVFIKKLPRPAYKTAIILSRLFACAVCAILAAASVKFLRDEAQAGTILFTMGSLEMKAVWLESILPLGFILVGLHTLTAFLRDE